MLRSAAEAMGLLSLSAGHLAAVKLRNATLRATVYVAAACIAEGAPFCIENPIHQLHVDSAFYAAAAAAARSLVHEH